MAQEPIEPPRKFMTELRKLAWAPRSKLLCFFLAFPGAFGAFSLFLALVEGRPQHVLGAPVFFVLMGVAHYLLSPSLSFNCPHCDKHLSTEDAWICGYCDRLNEAFHFVRRSILTRCRYCPNAPKAYICKHCGGIIILDASNDARRAARPVQPQTPVPTPDQLRRQELQEHEYQRTRITSETAIVKAKAAYEHARRQLDALLEPDRNTRGDADELIDLLEADLAKDERDERVVEAIHAWHDYKVKFIRAQGLPKDKEEKLLEQLKNRVDAALAGRLV